MLGFSWKQLLVIAVVVMLVSIYVQPRVAHYFPKA